MHSIDFSINVSDHLEYILSLYNKLFSRIIGNNHHFLHLSLSYVTKILKYIFILKYLNSVEYSYELKSVLIKHKCHVPPVYLVSMV